jgi:hypothetical protein
MRSDYPVKTPGEVRTVLKGWNYYHSSIPRQVGEEVPLPDGGCAILVER